MALNYNLAKVYAISENDTEFVLQIVSLFISEVPADLQLVREGIEQKNYKQAYSFAHKIKPTLDLLGMTVAFEEILVVEEWTKREGKRKEIKDTFKDIEERVEKAVKEIRKDFNL
ncbi:histidine kinase [Flavobacterium magnum]|uniref:Histidine kinase n=1 Tax=Flavobacterium magnum TaxID=2162713 RepID=A0A2S0RFJ8_9FLAO|nr:Hpt domain-containing protein [Flavobacterium magnum]AWA30018.1 histidine kinase [Flavobacterium magnum]